jgi:hypothetical protein
MNTFGIYIDQTIKVIPDTYNFNDEARGEKSHLERLSERNC